MRKVLRLKAITLLELSILLLILALAVPAILLLFNYGLYGQTQALLMTTATFLAQAKMEETLLKDFYEINPCTFNYDGCGNSFTYQEEGSFEEPFGEYKFKLTLDFIMVSPLWYDSEIEFLSSEYRSNFQHIKIEVWHNNYPNRTVKLDTILTPWNY